MGAIERYERRIAELARLVLKAGLSLEIAVLVAARYRRELADAEGNHGG